MCNRDEFEKWILSEWGEPFHDFHGFESGDGWSYSDHGLNAVWIGYCKGKEARAQEGGEAPIVWINPDNIKRTMIASPGETVEVSAYRDGEFTAPLYTHPSAELTAARDEAERLRARVAELESIVDGPIRPYVMRKQAEAVEALAARLQVAADKADEGPDESDTACTLLIAKSVSLTEAQRLRQQAQSIERGE